MTFNTRVLCVFVLEQEPIKRAMAVRHTNNNMILLKPLNCYFVFIAANLKSLSPGECQLNALLSYTLHWREKESDNSTTVHLDLAAE